MGFWKSLIQKVLPWKNSKRDCCTFWPDGVWQDCCCQHDDDYKYGEIPKRQADIDLRECVIASGHPIVAEAMYEGVSVGAWIPWLNHRRRNLKRPTNEKLA